MGIKLLLADDSITIQKVVGIIFAGEDYHLAIVDNGDAALVKAREIRPDVLLVDAVMPGLTGYEVCEEIRRDPSLKGIPILLLTGAFEPVDEEKGRRCGADDFITKPFESQHLIDKVTNLAELGKLRMSAAPAPGVAAAPSAPAIENPVHPSVTRVIPSAAPFVPPPAAPRYEEAAPAAPPQFTIEVVEGTPDDDLWGTFELEEVLEEPESAAQPMEFTPKWEPVEEEAFAFAEEEDAGAFEIVPEDQCDIFGEEATTVFETVPAESEDFFAEAAEPAAEEFAWTETAPPPEGEFELQFAPEEEYVPVAEAISPTAPPAAAPVPGVAGEPSLNEDQLAALVSRISRDLIEKIAWEVVPDLAERIIREEIRKIKEGQ